MSPTSCAQSVAAKKSSARVTRDSYFGVPYRDDYSATQERVRRLEEALADALDELDDLRQKYAKARAVLALVAESKKVEQLLEEQRTNERKT